MNVSWRALSVQTAILLCVNAVAATILIALLIHGSRARELLATPAAAQSLPDYPTERPRDVSHLPVLQEHILLYAARRTFVRPSSIAAPPRPDYRLVGTFIIPAKPAVALLSGANGTSHRVKPGDILDGWTVEMVEANRVTLRFDKDTFELASAAPHSSGLIVQSSSATSAIRVAQVAPQSGIRLLGKPSAFASPTPQPLHEPKLTPRLYRPPSR